MNINKYILKEIMEDALRITVEKGNDVISVSMLKEDIFAPDEFFIEAIDELEKEGLVRIENHQAMLTRKGREKAGKILARHEIIEKYFHEILGEPMPHNTAHALEHFVSNETIIRMKELVVLKGKGKSLVDFLPGRKVLIIAVEIPDKRVFERIIGLGLNPGSRITIEEKIPDAIILNIGGRKVALAKEIAKSILAVTEDEEY